MRGEPTILIVEDEENCREMYKNWLAGEYRVRTAGCGREALRELDPAVDVVLLDRRMTGLSGARTAAAIRRRVSDCHVVMVTAVEPGTDIVGMDIDDYVSKPIRGPRLRAVVERMLARTAFHEEMQELFALASIKATLETERHPGALRDDPEYTELCRQLDETRARVSAAHATADMDWGEAFETCGTGGGTNSFGLA
jgi:two-component system response regulator AdeR